MSIDFSLNDAYKTGVQESGFVNDSIDLGYDFVMIYGFHELESRIDGYKSLGYDIQFMTGISWGEYQDYLLGDFDGTVHWDDAQKDKHGNYILHGPLVPYMVPTSSYCNYLIEKLKKVIDLGITRIHLEEPEFWQHGGYSKSFQFEFASYYKKPWKDQETDIQTFYETSKLKAILYAKAIDYISSEIKSYGMSKYQKYIYVYVPTHSLLNYTQWKIMSPEGLLAKINSIDGFIAQVWTGTSREKNSYKGIVKERTFETAFLEYGIMQSLIYQSNQTMWFLNDPIEDNPTYQWSDYKYHYEKTLIASLLHPSIDKYEISPWPLRIFNRKLPITDNPNIRQKFIPKSYDQYLNQVFQVLHHMPLGESNYIQQDFKLGLVLSDAAMYERDMPSHMKSFAEQETTSLGFPAYYGLALPLINLGIPVLGASMERLSDIGYLDQFDCLVLSYDYQKPDSPTIHDHLYRYINNGGLVIFIGNSEDRFQSLDAWWNKKLKDLKPIHHLLDLTKIKTTECQHKKIGLGQFSYFHQSTHEIALETNKHDIYIDFIKKALKKSKISFKPKPFIGLERGNYIIVAGLSESLGGKQYYKKGMFVDMLNTKLPIINEIRSKKDRFKVYYDLEKSENLSFVGISYRYKLIEKNNNNIIYELTGKKNLTTYARYKTHIKPLYLFKSGIEIPFEYDELTKTILFKIRLDSRMEVLTFVYE